MVVSHNKQFVLNLICSVMAFLVNAGIQFLIAPILMILGRDFLILWQNFRTKEEISTVYTILVLSILLLMLTVPVVSLSQMELTANKMKWQMMNN